MLLLSLPPPFLSSSFFHLLLFPSALLNTLNTLSTKTLTRFGARNVVEKRRKIIHISYGGDKRIVRRDVVTWRK
jgi:hypothetical protein